MDTITLRPYRPSDSDELARMFFETVHAVNAADYSPAALNAWAPANRDLTAWAASFEGKACLVAAQGERIVGFGDIVAEQGYLDRLFVHRDFQRRGIATALCDGLEHAARAAGASIVLTHASITARPFFEQRGYRVTAREEVERGGVALVRFAMEKTLARRSDRQ